MKTETATATDKAYDLMELLAVLEHALYYIGERGDPNHTANLGRSTARVIERIAIPLAGDVVDAAERADRALRAAA